MYYLSTCIFVTCRPVSLCVYVCVTVEAPPLHQTTSSYGDCLEVKREYYQNCSVLDCVTQCSQSAAHLCEQFLQVKQIGFVTLGPLRCL